MTDSAPPVSQGRHHVRFRAAPQLLLLLTGVAIFVGTLDQTVVVTILPDIIKNLQIPVARFGQMTWIVNGYLLGFTVALPLVGRLADAYGHLRCFLACLAIFAVGSAAVALAPNLELLVVARAFQAIGGGGVLPVGMAIAADVLPERRRSLGLGALAATNNASSLIGPLWGALLVGAGGWRGVFWLNIPLILPIGLALAWLAKETPTGRRASIDWRGAFLLAAGLTAATVALTDDGANPRPVLVSLTLAATGAAFIAAFVWSELRTEQPMIQLRSFGRTQFSVAMLIYFLIGGALIVALVDMPLMTNVLFKQSSLQGGLNLMRLLVMLPIGGVAGGLLCAGIGYRATAGTGVALAIAGFLLMRAWTAVPSGTDLWVALGLIGFGLGLCDAPIVSTVFDSVHRGERATSAALLLISWTCGMIAGLALLGTQGLGSFNTQAARLFREQGLNLEPGEIEHLMRRTFNGTLLGAVLVLVLALGLTALLRGGRGRHVRWSPVAGLEE